MSESDVAQSVTLAYRLTRSDLRAAGRAWRRRLRLRLVVFFATAVVMCFVASSFTGNAKYFVLGTFASLLAYALFRLLQIRLLRASGEHLGDVTMTVEETGLVERNAHSTTESTWSAYRGYVENDEVFVLYDQIQFATLRILPKRACSSPEEIERLRTLIHGHLTVRS